MTVSHFVGRQDAVERIVSILVGNVSKGPCTIQSIEGPGGIGKTCLFDHVLTVADTVNRNYLTLRVDGNDSSKYPSMSNLVSRIVNNAQANEIGDKPLGFYFPSVDRVIKAMEIIRLEAALEFQKLQPENDDGKEALMQFINTIFAAGKSLNEAFPGTKEKVNVEELEKAKQKIDDILPSLDSIREESAKLWERTGLFSANRAFRNSIKKNACGVLADALVSDLSAILKQYRPQDKAKPTHKKIPGIDRLLLILDDYETLQTPLGEFLVAHLLPKLKLSNFESTVFIMGRDQLQATHPGWDQHLKNNLLKSITLDRLSRNEMDKLVESFDITSMAEKDRVWTDTDGYPFYVQLWIEEAESGGRSAVMLKRFYERTTRWMNDQEKKWLWLTLFLDNVNIRSLRIILGSENEAKEAFRWFEREGSIRDPHGSTFRIRGYLQSRLADYLRISDPDRYDELERLSRSSKIVNL